MPAPPIQNVPDEVLQEIFLQCIPEHTWRTSLEPLDCPVLLSHVCQRWRKVSLAFPGLWKTLRCDVLRIKFNESKLQLLAAATARARLYPRNLQLIIRTRFWSDDERGEDAFYPIPNVASGLTAPGNASSLTRLTLKGIPIPHLHCIPSGSFPSLIDLVLKLLGDDLNLFPWATKGPLKAFSEAPALRRVCLDKTSAFDHRGPRRSVSENIVLPWEQLTHLLNFDGPERPSSISPRLFRCLNLQYIFVTLGESDVGPEGHLYWGDIMPTRLDKLQSLHLHFWGCVEGEVGYPALIDIFDFQNLEALRLDGAEFNFDDDSLNIWRPLALVDRFLSKISDLQHLTYLSLCISSIAPDTLRRVLSATPHVKTLDGFVYENYENLFEGLTWGTDKLLPKLETLGLELDNSVALDDNEGDTINPDAFRAFLESRVQNDECSSFRRIVVYSGWDSALDDEVPFIGVALQYVPRGLVFERRLVGDERNGRAHKLWMARDPGLYDWPELVELR